MKRQDSSWLGNMGTTYTKIAESLSPNSKPICDLVHIFGEARKAKLQFLLDLHTADEDRRYFSSVVLPANQAWLAEVDGHPAGFIAFAPGWVNHLYVLPQFQSRGVGTHLLDIAKQQNQSLDLWVFEANVPAIKFYQRRGFRMIERTDGNANEAKKPDVRMRWRGTKAR